MKIGDVAVLAGVVGAGVLLWSKWDEIKSMFGSWGVGPDAPVRPPDTPIFVPPSVAPYVKPIGIDPSLLPDIMPIPPPRLIDFIFPPAALLPHDPVQVPVMPTPPSPPSLIGTIFPPAEIIARIIPVITPKPKPRVSKPIIYTPSPPTHYDVPKMVSDPARPSGSFGGR